LQSKVRRYSTRICAIICAALPAIRACWKEAWDASLAKDSFRITFWKDADESRLANASFLAIRRNASSLISRLKASLLAKLCELGVLAESLEPHVLGRSRQRPLE
jgi:hypothetical protein